MNNLEYPNEVLSQDSATASNVKSFVRIKNKKYDLDKIFDSRPINEFIIEASLQADPQSLFGTLWYEGEMCFLFADANLGKSVLGLQIADSLTKGKTPFVNTNDLDLNFPEPLPQKILFFDLELRSKQIEKRYRQDDSHYSFSDNLIRCVLDFSNEMPDLNYSDFILEAIEQKAQAENCKICIIDNLTFLAGDTEKAKDALVFMQHLDVLKKKHGLSFLIIGHPPKRDAHRPISINDLSGSAKLGQFIDSAFAIGKSTKDAKIRYIKQIKCRDGEFTHDADNVIICDLVKENSFLHFKPIALDHEISHLSVETEKTAEDRDNKIMELHEKGQSYREIGTALKISHQTVKRVLERLKKV